MSSNALVTLSPPATLPFQLERGQAARTILKIKNTSRTKIIFKVKTTQPNWYYVRPNQQVLDVNQSEDVSIIIVDAEMNKYLDQVASDSVTEAVDKHRFLVQSKIISDNDFNLIQEMPQAKRSEELAKLWDKGDEEKKSAKLKVEFTCVPEVVAPAPTAKPSVSIQESSEDLKSKLQRKNKDQELSSSSPEVIIAELQNLRKKYDNVVEYTVNLTSERDSIVAQLEAAQRELAKERPKKKDGKEVGTRLEKKVEKGFSLFVVLITALIAFLIGKYVA